jgi:tRNA nucleotidyltransferase (CCA-adding enzyme)
MGGSRARIRPIPGASLSPGLDQALGRLVALAGLSGASIYLVGGSVRDLFLGRLPQDLDLMTSGDAIILGQEFVRLHGGKMTAHVRFRTAAIDLPGGIRVDLASPRQEIYTSSGRLPQVSAAEVTEDLKRRDFSVNAMAWCWRRRGPGTLLDPFDGREDLRRRWIRILHPASFQDDPTRGFRAVRLAARLGFRLERSTAVALGRAIDDGLITALSAARKGRELRLLALEQDWPVAVARTARAGLLRAVHRSLVPPSLPACRRVQRALSGRPTAEALPVVLACLGMGAEGPAPSGALDSLQISGGACRRASLLLAAARTLGRRLAGLTPARINMAVLARLALDLEDDALLLVEGTDQRAAVRRLLGRFRRRRLGLTLNVTAADLMAAGVPRGPELAQRLAAIRRALLSGRPAGSHLELGYALSARPRSSRTGNRGEV